MLLRFSDYNLTSARLDSVAYISAILHLFPDDNKNSRFPKYLLKVISIP